MPPILRSNSLRSAMVEPKHGVASFTEVPTITFGMNW